ncbi:J domain-containing protein [Nibribacter ruber]|uniref:J domain-containing protein n=1 Tax=Nibribacter ruber TaxID=2698458 RepID=A0A6P1P4D8_9BACT|nr:J domain-containing protein [Nibribacter ruber]QHL89253.1 J domain-containing protein [Nibribacter ruber]
MAKRKPSAKENFPTVTGLSTSGTTPQQQEFNQHVAKINFLKEQLAQQRASLAAAQVRVQKEVQPLIRQLVEKRTAFVRLLDRAYHLEFFQKQEKEKIAYLIEKLAFDLIDTYGAHDLKDLYAQYNPEAASAVSTAEDEVPDAPEQAPDPDDYDAWQVQEQQRREAQQKARQQAKKKKAQATELKLELTSLTKASRKIYTTLVKLLHPDKERDEQTRLWKEEAMKRVTIAYNQDDFFELLRLQMEFLHLEEAHLDQVPEDQLQYYLKLLHDQIQELERELQHFQTGPQANFYQRFAGTERQMDLKFRKVKKELKDELSQLDLEIRVLEEPLHLREFLKKMRNFQ